MLAYGVEAGSPRVLVYGDRVQLDRDGRGVRYGEVWPHVEHRGETQRLAFAAVEDLHPGAAQRLDRVPVGRGGDQVQQGGLDGPGQYRPAVPLVDRVERQPTGTEPGGAYCALWSGGARLPQDRGERLPRRRGDEARLGRSQHLHHADHGACLYVGGHRLSNFPTENRTVEPFATTDPARTFWRTTFLTSSGSRVNVS